MVNFPTCIPGCDSHSPPHLNSFLSSDANFSLHCLWLFSCWLGQSSWWFERCSWEKIFKFSASPAAHEFCEWVQVGNDVYIPHWKYQVKSDSSPCFSAACAAAIVHRSHFFVCTKRISLLNLKKSSDRLVIVTKLLEGLQRFLKFPNLHMLMKQKSALLPRNLALVTSSELPITFSTKVNLRYLFYSTAHRCCLLHLIKQNCWLKMFLWSLILMSQVSFYLFFPVKLIWNCIIFL